MSLDTKPVFGLYCNCDAEPIQNQPEKIIFDSELVELKLLTKKMEL